MPLQRHLEAFQHRSLPNIRDRADINFQRFADLRIRPVRTPRPTVCFQQYPLMGQFACRCLAFGQHGFRLRALFFDQRDDILLYDPEPPLSALFPHPQGGSSFRCKENEA
jgi:hypothetical protein